MADFDGTTYERERDHGRLYSQLLAVRDIMLDGRWRTLSQLSAETGDPEASISARLRDLRKPKFGGYVVERSYVSNGVWQYRLLNDKSAPEDDGKKEAKCLCGRLLQDIKPTTSPDFVFGKCLEHKDQVVRIR